MLSTQVRGLAGPSRSVPDEAVREALEREDTPLVSWHRELPPGLDTHLEPWARSTRERFDDVLALRHDDLSGATRGVPDSVRAWVTTDIAALVAHLAQVADVRRVRVSFGPVHTDQCRKFHVDYVRYRLITTYLGPGTEWLPEHAVRREALDQPTERPSDANAAIVRDAGAIHHAVAGDVLLMRGATHGGFGAVHRSPPIEAAGLVRVVLTLSTVDGG